MSVVLLAHSEVEARLRPKLDTLHVVGTVLEATHPGTLAGERALALYAETLEAALDAALDLLGIER